MVLTPVRRTKLSRILYTLPLVLWVRIPSGRPDLRPPRLAYRRPAACSVLPILASMRLQGCTGTIEALACLSHGTFSRRFASRLVLRPVLSAGRFLPAGC